MWETKRFFDRAYNLLENINRFLNNKKVPVVPPLLVNGEIISNFSQEAVIFNKYFVSQYTLLLSLPALCLRTENTGENDIFTVIKNLKSNKSHGWDDLSIKMIKLCRRFIVYPLKLILKPLYLLGGEFLECCKRANVVPVYSHFFQKNWKSDFQGLV